MTPDSLKIIVNNLTSALSAWRTASEAGSKHVINLSNTILTLSDNTIHAATKPAPGTLAALHADGEASARWLQLCLTRLAKILRGAQDCVQTLNSVQDASFIPIWSVPVSKWTDMADRFVRDLEKDLSDKRHVMDYLTDVVEGAPIDRGEMEINAARWLEQPQVDSSAAELLTSILETELCAKRVEDSLEVCSPGRLVVDASGSGAATPSSKTGGVSKVESPALAFLRQSGKKKR